MSTNTARPRGLAARLTAPVAINRTRGCDGGMVKDPFDGLELNATEGARTTHQDE